MKRKRGRNIILHFSIAYVMKAGGAKHSYTDKLVILATPEVEVGR